MTDPVAERAEVEAAQAGNRASLELLLRRHQPQIHAVCRRITGNDTDALDATQEALIAIVKGSSPLRRPIQVLDLGVPRHHQRLPR
jgi:DNA-directed RNA polymerase specialized sigma24 family protein